MAVNKHGNIYEKTNTGKIVGTVVGAGAGAGIAYANLDGIKKRCSGLLKDIDKDILQLKIGIGGDKKDIELLKKSRNFIKSFGKHPVAICAAAGAIPLFLLGTIPDAVSNKIRSHMADKSQDK